MSKINLTSSFLLVDSLQHSAAIGARIESHGVARRRIPNEIRIHRHVVISRIELGEAVDFADRFRAPVPRGKFPESSGVQFQNRRDALDRIIVGRPRAQVSDSIGRDVPRAPRAGYRKFQARAALFR